MNITRHLVIRGLVQGVWFRESMRYQADALGVAGWVRNRRDGTVEAMVQGADDAVQAMIAWARRGPDGARVEGVDVAEGWGEYAAFERRESA